MRYTLSTLLLGLSLPAQLLAADDYVFSAFESTSPYTPLQSPTVVVQNAAMPLGNYVTIPIGFPFSYWGGSYTEFICSSYAYCLFGQQSSYGFYPFYTYLTGLGDSQVGYQLDQSGGPGQRILKVEWKHVGFLTDNTHMDHTSFQIWLHEGSNAVEIHYGPSAIPAAHYQTDLNGSVGPQVAFAAPDLNSFYNLQGDAGAPAAIYDPMSFLYVAGYPGEGTIYRFSPRSQVGIDELTLSAEVRLFPQPAQDILSVELPPSLAEAGVAYEILDERGRRVQQGMLDLSTRGALHMAGLPQGVYVLALHARGLVLRRRFVRA